MNRDIEVLNNIYKIVDMGIIGIDNVLTKIQSKALEKIFIDERREYNLIRIDAIKLLGDYEQKAKGISKMAEVSSTIMTDMELLKNDSDNKITKMMLNGSNNGIIELTSLLNKGPVKNPKVEELSQKLLETLEHNIQDLKKYL